ncbi:MAG: fibronectin type III domain-containing protein [Hymenobacter sp.]
MVLYESNNLNQRTLLSNARDTTVLAPGLRFNTTYYWQVTVRTPAGPLPGAPCGASKPRACPTTASCLCAP